MKISIQKLTIMDHWGKSQPLYSFVSHNYNDSDEVRVLNLYPQSRLSLQSFQQMLIEKILV